MLETIFEALEEPPPTKLTPSKRLLRFLDERFVFVTEMMAGPLLTHRPNFRKNYLRPALEHGFLEVRHPEAPRHPRQMYRLTGKGRMMKALLG